jgi:hypothetical protein
LSLVFSDCLAVCVEVIGDLSAEFFCIDFTNALEELDGFAEVLAFDGHGEVDGVEVLLAGEASGEISFGVGGGIKSSTEGT